MRLCFRRFGWSLCAERVLLIVLALLPIAHLHADVVPLVQRPVAPRSGIMMLPVGIDPAAPHAEPTVTDARGRPLRARLAWFRSGTATIARTPNWTDDPRLPVPVNERMPEGAVLLIELEPGMSGDIFVGAQRLTPIWSTPPQPSIADSLGGKPEGTLSIETAPNRPSPDQPLEHFRWVLLADELGMHPPDTSRFAPLEAQVAQATTDLWRIGLARLARISAGVARACRRALVHRVHDGDSEIAAWVTDPQLLDELLRLLLDPVRSERRLLGDALAWSDLVPPLIAWLDDHDPASATLAIINRGPRSIELTIGWETFADEPRAVLVPADRLKRVRVDRPRAVVMDVRRQLRPEDRATDAGLTMDTLRIDATMQSIRLDIPPPIDRALPPGPVLGPFLPPPTLADLELRRPPLLSLPHMTNGELRQREGRWELFFDCRRPARAGAAIRSRADEDDEDLADPLRGIRSADEMIGREGLTLIIGGSEAPRAILTIPEDGWWRLLEGTNDGSLQVHRRSLADRWYCRIVLPADWLRITDRTPYAMFTAVRTHESGASAEVMPHAAVPWRRELPSRRIDLVHWDDLP